jgi:hypothetical protein
VKPKVREGTDLGPREIAVVLSEECQNFVCASMYEQTLEKHIGVSFAKDGEFWLIDWCLLEFAWEYDSVLEELLKRDNPFLPLREAEFERYNFE